MTIYIVRHGQTEENKVQILQGHLPGVLTEKGREQVRMAAERLTESGVEYSGIVSSDLKRAMDSAAIIGERLGMEVVAWKTLRERDWGSYTGITVSEARDKYYKDGKWDFPEAEHPVESGEQLMARACRVLQELKERYGDGNVIVVTHGLFARHLIAARFGCDYREVTPLVNAEVRVIKVVDTLPSTLNLTR